MTQNTYIIGAIVIILVLGGWYLFSNRSTSPSVNTATTGAQPMSFFVTSVNPGNGGNLAGLAGADAYCKTLADSAGATGKIWHAYLSAGASGTSPVVNARDRIGSGPWYNKTGVLIASNLNELHGDNNINKATALTEKGDMVPGRGDAVNMHDILTGSKADGTFLASTTADTTCGNWTVGSGGSAQLGHHDRMGLDDSTAAKSWNSSHISRGCSLDELKSTGGAGLFYCFAE
jgi:hypothetical protein